MAMYAINHDDDEKSFIIQSLCCSLFLVLTISWKFLDFVNSCGVLSPLIFKCLAYRHV